MFDTKNALIEKLKTNQEKLNDDEYIGEDGLPYCKTCGGARYFCVNDEKGIYMRTIWCKHRKEEQQRAEEEEARRKRIEEFNARQESSLIGKRYKNIRFNDARITEHNREAYEKCKRYLEQSEAMLKENIGLYIHGENSTGKTYLFSSNYTIAELESVLGFDKAIVERINEMATRVIKLTGDDFRQTARASKSTLAKKYGI